MTLTFKNSFGGFPSLYILNLKCIRSGWCAHASTWMCVCHLTYLVFTCTPLSVSLAMSLVIPQPSLFIWSRLAGQVLGSLPAGLTTPVNTSTRALPPVWRDSNLQYEIRNTATLNQPKIFTCAGKKLSSIDTTLLLLTAHDTSRGPALYSTRTVTACASKINIRDLKEV